MEYHLGSCRGVCDALTFLLDIFVRFGNKWGEGSPCLACDNRGVFFTSEQQRKYHLGSCQGVCDMLTFLLDIFVRFGTWLCRRVFGVPVGTNCALRLGWCRKLV